MNWWPFSKKCKSNEKSQINEKTSDKNSSHLDQDHTEKPQEDVLINAKVGATHILPKIIQVMKSERGLHLESLLSALGALAGYACQAGIREEFVNQKGHNENQVFTVVGCADGRQYFFGDMVNNPLAQNQYSVWGLAAGAAQHLGTKELIDIMEIFKHVTQSVGTEEFGIPRIEEGHKPADLPQNYIKHLWPFLLPDLKALCPAAEWPILFGLAIQQIMDEGKDLIDPKLALSIVMESAVPMSKIDFNSL